MTALSYPLSRGQRALWFLDRLAPGNPAYVIAGGGRVRGGLDVAALRRALAALAARHPALRTTFHEGAEGPYQQVHELAEVELIELPPCGDEAELARLLSEIAYRPFDLQRGPLWRLGIVPLAAGGHALVLAIHHIVADFWSLGILVRELGALYGQELLEPPGLSYGEWLERQEELLAGPAGERLWEFWRQELPEGPFALELPTDRPRPPVQTYRGGFVAVELPAELNDALRRQGRKRGATPLMVLLAAFQAVLARWTGQEKLLVGTPTTGRRSPEVAGLVGYLVNPVVVVADLAGEPTFEELLSRARERALAAFEHQDYPFTLLAERLQPERDPSRSPVFQVMLVLQKGRRQGEEGIAALWAGESGAVVPMGPLELESIGLDDPGAQLELSVGLAESGGRLVGRWQYNRDLYDAPTVERMAGHLRILLEGALAGPPASLSARVADLPLLGEAERHQVLAEWNDTAAPLPEQDVLTAFRSWARRTPEALAAVCGEERLTYGELHRRARRLAARLRRQGVGPETVVGLCLERSPELLVGIVGVLEAGGAYLPLDPGQPAERLAYALEDAGALLALDRAAIRSLATGAGPPSPLAPMPGQLAYVIYTSGSTGKPKGTELTHAGLANLVAWYRRAYQVKPEDRASLVAGVGFDASVWEVWSYLTAGASLWLPAAEVVAEPEALLAWLAEREITLAFLPTPLLEASLAETLPAGLSLRALLTGGDRLHRGAPEGAGFVVGNLYGPTEATVVTTASRVAPGLAAPAIGRPVANLRVHLLDRHLRPVPLGAAGELCAGGVGLARGYRNRPELTAERFVPDPLAAAPGERLYRTGDLARYRPGGELEFLGRIDQQVKVRGIRIELGEVESALAGCPGVREAAVVAVGEGGRRRLVGFVTPAGQDTAELRERLKAVLPSYMVPATLAALDDLPLTANGKVDRRELAKRALAVPEETGGEAPRTPGEELLAGTFAELLGVARVGLDDDFFHLGGHSLLATRLLSRVREAFGAELPLSRLFAAPTVRALAREIESARRAGRPQAPPIRPVPRDRELPLSFAQERLWLAGQLAPGGAVYNVPGALRLRGRLDAPALAAGLAEVVRRHEALRTTFAVADFRPVQVIAPPCVSENPLPVVDLGALPARLREAAAARLAREEAERPFDLAAGPLLRCCLLRLEEREHALLVTLHHIVSDGWSLEVFLRELAALYRAALTGAPAGLPELPIQYADFAVWQREHLAGAALDEQLAYWRAQLAGAQDLLDLPLDRPRPAVQSHRGALRPVPLPAGLGRELAALARREGATLFMVLLAALYALLFRHTGQEDLLVGSPAAGRTRLETEGLIGFFVNTLVLRAALAGDLAFRDLLAGVRASTLDAYAHQDLPFEKLVEELAPQRSLAYNPLFQVMLALQGSPLAALELPGLSLAPLESAAAPAKFDLVLAATEVTGAGGGLSARWAYATDLFDPSTIDRLSAHLANLLAGIAADPGRPLRDLPLLSGHERHQLQAEWSRADDFEPWQGGALAHEMVEAQVRRDPGAPALLFEDEVLTYGEVDARANRLAHHLRRLGVGLEDRVGLFLERSCASAVGLLAVLKAGAAYVPLDPSLPPERLSFLLEDARLAVLLTSRDLLGRLPAAAPRRVLLEPGLADVAGERCDPPASGVLAGNAAYVIYTSGSTGRSKGVVVGHRALANRLDYLRTVELRRGDRQLHKTTLSFDPSITELLGPLVAGAAVVMARPGGERDSSYLIRLIDRQGVTHISFAMAMLSMLVDDPGFATCRSLRLVLTGGEVVPPDLPQRFFGKLEAALQNRYGPTEATISVTSWRCGDARDRHAVPIGRPYAGAEILLLDRDLRPVPVGVTGELHIGGACLARGYLDRPELTAERFVPHPFPARPGARLYRTGDLARYRADGAIEFLGRYDRQVKIRGFRVELGDVEAALAGHPGVREAVVIAREEPATRTRSLAGFVLPRNGAAPGPAELREFLGANLPGHMVPAALVVLEAFPRFPSGKLDVRALLQAVPAGEGEAGPAYEPPGTPVEELLAGIWAEVLGVERVGIHDNFFGLGGHSLRATQVLLRVKVTFGVDLPVQRFFESPTVAGLALALAEEMMARAGEDELAEILADLS